MEAMSLPDMVKKDELFYVEKKILERSLIRDAQLVHSLKHKSISTSCFLDNDMKLKVNRYFIMGSITNETIFITFQNVRVYTINLWVNTQKLI